MTHPDQPAAGDVVDPRHEAVAAYLLEEVEVYCSSSDSALRRAGEIIAAIDAAENAEITRLRARVAELRKPDLRTLMGFETGRAEADALRARVAGLRSSIAHVVTMVDEIGDEENETLRGITNHCYGALMDDDEPTPDPRDASLPWPCTCGRTDTHGCDRCDPRDARIAELEAALLRGAAHPAIRAEMYGGDVALADRIKRERALGGGHG